MAKSNQGAFVNGVFYGWARFETTLAGARLVAFKSIEWDDGVEREMVYGAGQAPLGAGDGNYSANVKMTVLLEDFEDVLLPQLGEPVYAHEPFDATLTYSKPGGKVVRRDLKGIRLNKISEKNAQGDKEAPVEIEAMAFGGIWRSGKKPVAVGSG